GGRLEVRARILPTAALPSALRNPLTASTVATRHTDRTDTACEVIGNLLHRDFPGSPVGGLLPRILPAVIDDIPLLGLGMLHEGVVPRPFAPVVAAENAPTVFPRSFGRLPRRLMD